MSKELEALENIECNCELYDFKYEDFEIIEKALKALEIIKEKGLSLNELWYIERNEPWSVYIEKMREVYFDDECVVENKLKTQEEYGLLKEVLL